MRFDTLIYRKIFYSKPCYGRAGARSAASPWLKSSSTSARCGAAKAPPNRVHFRAAAAEANRSACRSSCFSVMASAKAPWKTSPAPRVSTVCTGKAGVSWISPVLVEPDRAPRAPGARQERRGQLGDLLQRLGVVGDVGGLLQRLAGEHQVRRGVQQALAQRHRPVDVDDHGNAAPDGLGAKLGAEFGAAALGEDGRAVVQQRVEIGQLDLPQLLDRGRSRWCARR